MGEIALSTLQKLSQSAFTPTRNIEKFLQKNTPSSYLHNFWEYLFKFANNKTKIHLLFGYLYLYIP